MVCWLLVGFFTPTYKSTNTSTHIRSIARHEPPMGGEYHTVNLCGQPLPPRLRGSSTISGSRTDTTIFENQIVGNWMQPQASKQAAPSPDQVADTDPKFLLHQKKWTGSGPPWSILLMALIPDPNPPGDVALQVFGGPQIKVSRPIPSASEN